MGCDIHMHIEIKIEGNWEHYANPSCRRNYTIFGKLANVRTEDPDHFNVKGLPSDITKITEYDYKRYESDNHTPSYITGNEIIEFSEWMRNEKPSEDLEHHYLHTYLFGNSFAGFYKYPEDNPDWLEDIRFVFWFDN